LIYYIQLAHSISNYVIAMSADKVQEGDKVSWNWNGNHPGGTVGEVKEGEVSVTSHRGNEITKTGDASDPAVHIERPGNDVVKLASELDVESKGDSATGDGKEEEKKAGEDAKEEKEEKEEIKDKEYKKEENGIAEKKEDTGNDEAKAGEKRKADEKADGDNSGVKDDDINKKEDDEHDAKKQKTSGETKAAANGTKKSAGKKEKKAPAVGQTERRTRSQTKA